MEIEERLNKAYNMLKDDNIFKTVIGAKDDFFEKLEGLDKEIADQFKANDQKIKILYAGPVEKL